jgi:cytochrome d ubiquinol oxidase subunit I
MVGLGTLFIALMALCAFLQLRGRLLERRWLLWGLMLAFPFPYIANTAGWMTAELGRQPWLVYGLLRTADGASPSVHGGTVLKFLPWRLATGARLWRSGHARGAEGWPDRRVPSD